MKTSWIGSKMWWVAGVFWVAAPSWAQSTLGASAPIDPSLMTWAKSAPVAPPTALPPLPMGPGESTMPRTVVTNAETSQAHEVERPKPLCPNQALVVHDIMEANDERQANVCDHGVFHPAMKVGDKIEGADIVSIDLDSVWVERRHRREKLKMLD